MLRNNLLIVSLLAFAGCATPPPGIEVQTQKVEVPVQVFCKTPTPPAPVLNFDKVTTQDDIYTKVQALLADRDLQLGYETSLVAALNSCK